MWQQAVDDAAELGVDALILADTGMMRYASRAYVTAAGLRIDFTVDGSGFHAVAKHPLPPDLAISAQAP